MFKQRIAPALALVLALFAPVVHAYFDQPWITPENPRAGETVYVNIHGGICDAIATSPNYPQIAQEGNAISFVVSGVHVDNSEWCIYGEGTATYSIGAYAPGTYILTAEMLYTDFFGQPGVLNIGSVSFTVLGAALPPTPVPATGSVAFALLLALLAGLAVYSIRRTRDANILLALLALIPLGARANGQYLIDCVKGDSGAPTPAQIVSWVNAKPRVLNTTIAGIRHRGTCGCRLPDSRSRVRRFSGLAWPEAHVGTCEARALHHREVQPSAALLRSRPIPGSSQRRSRPEWSHSAVELGDFGIAPDPPQGEAYQYGWFDLNLDAAWRLAGGYALVGVVDSGLNPESAALKQFNGATTWVVDSCHRHRGTSD